MTSAVAKYAAKKMLSSEMTKYKGKSVESDYDPFYEMIPHPKKPGKMKKVKKQIPAYIPSHDADILAKARKRAYKLDFCLFNFLGFRFGWSSVIGLVPAVGDGLDALLALRLIWLMRGAGCGLPQGTILLMLLNLAIDFLVGLIPFVGDLADAAIKCNSKNVRLFEAHLDKVYKPKAMVDADKAAGRKRRPATVYEDFSDDELEGLRDASFENGQGNVQQPGRAYSPTRARIPDEEMGIPRQNTQRSRREEPSRNQPRSGRR